MGVGFLIASSWPGDPAVQWNKKRKRLSRNLEPAAVLEYEFQEPMTDFLSDATSLDGLSVLSQWDPFGRPWYLRGEELDHIISELELAIARSAFGSLRTSALAAVLAMARRAREEGLVFVVQPD